MEWREPVEKGNNKISKTNCSPLVWIGGSLLKTLHVWFFSAGKISSIHKSRETGMMSPMSHHPHLNEHHYFAILASWISLKVEIIRPCPRRVLWWHSGMYLFPNSPGDSRNCQVGIAETLGPGTGACTCLKKRRSPPLPAPPSAHGMVLHDSEKRPEQQRFICQGLGRKEVIPDGLNEEAVMIGQRWEQG